MIRVSLEFCLLTWRISISSAALMKKELKETETVNLENITHKYNTSKFQTIIKYSYKNKIESNAQET
jgi:hypothetical protein